MSYSNKLLTGAGAVIVGATTYFTAINGAWYGVSLFSIPAFVITHRASVPVAECFTFTNEGLADALARATQAANGKNVWVMGGAGMANQCLAPGVPDKLYIHIAPVLPGGGTRLFDITEGKSIALEKIHVQDTPAATHLYYRVTRENDTMECKFFMFFPLKTAFSTSNHRL